MACRIYIEDEIVRIDFSGEITKEDLVEGLVAIEEIESRVTPVPHRIADLTPILSSANRFPEILKLSAARKAKRFPNEFKTALVAPTPVALGTARMFQTLNDHPQITVRIFPDLAAAKAWLAEEP
jgi:hypothetical protein